MDPTDFEDGPGWIEPYNGIPCYQPTGLPPEISYTDDLFSAVKRSLDVALRARIWYREFRELALMYAVYDIKKAAEQEIPIPSGD